MGEGNSALGQDLIDAHEAAIGASYPFCHFPQQARKVVEAYLHALDKELNNRGMAFAIFKKQDEQDN